MIVGRGDETTELLAIWLAIKDLSHDLSRATRVRVLTDSQGALRSIQNPQANDSIKLVLGIREHIRKATLSLH